MQPRPRRGRGEVEYDRPFTPRRHPAGDPSFPPLAEQLPHHLQGPGFVVSLVGDDDPHLEAGRPPHDLTRDLEPGGGVGGRAREDEREKSEEGGTTS